MADELDRYVADLEGLAGIGVRVGGGGGVVDVGRARIEEGGMRAREEEPDTSGIPDELVTPIIEDWVAENETFEDGLARAVAAWGRWRKARAAWARERGLESWELPGNEGQGPWSRERWEARP